MSTLSRTPRSAARIISRCGGPVFALLLAWGFGLAAVADKPAFGIDYNRPEQYLAQGPQTLLTRAELAELAPAILPRLGRLPAGLEQLAGIFEWLQSDFEPLNAGGRTIGVTTVRELLQGRRLAGCHDFALVFAAVARVLGYPAVVVDTAGLDWARAAAAGTKRGYVGHVFVEVFVDRRWVLVDSTNGPHVVSGYDPGNPAIPLGKGFYVMRKGADTWSCDIHSNQELQQVMDETAKQLQGVTVAMPAYAFQRWQRRAKQPPNLYALVTVNDQRVPARVSHAGVTLEVRSGSFTIGPGSICTSRMVVVPPSGSEVTRVVTATYTQAESTLTMTWQGAGTTTGTLAGDSFTMTNEGMVLVYSRGSLPERDARVAEAIEVQGWACRGNPDLDRKGRLKACTLAREHLLAGTATRLPAGTRIEFEEGEPRSCALGAAATVEGFMLPAGTEVVFGPHFEHPEKLNPWVRRTQGMPEGAMLRQEVTIRGITFPAGTKIHFQCFATSGEPGTWRCTLPSRMRIQGHLCEHGGEAVGTVLYASGKLRATSLAEDEVIDGVPCTSSTSGLPLKTRFYGIDGKVWFWENGHLQQGMVQRECTLEGRTFKPGDLVRMTSEGKLDEAADTTLGARSRLASNRPPPASYNAGQEGARRARKSQQPMP